MRDEIPTGVGLGLRAKFLRAASVGEAEGRVRFFELSPENYMHRGGRNPRMLEAVADRHPVITHGLMLSLGSTDPFDADYMRRLKAFLEVYGGKWHSDHLCFSGLGGGLLHDLLPLPLTKATAQRVADRVLEAQDRLGLPMVVENISYYLHMGEPQMSEAEFVCEVTERADCGLLLDVNNIFVNSRNFGFDPMEMLAAYPIDRTVQMHVAGHTPWEPYDMFVDTHGATVLAEVHQMMQWVIERRGALPVLLERDTDIPDFETLLGEVADLQRSYDDALARFENQSSGGPDAKGQDQHVR